MMLSRTADQLFWMSRSLERAENLARLLDVSYRLALMPQARGDKVELAVPMLLTGTLDSFHRRYPQLTPENMLNFMVFDSSNPASILGCLKNARDNAHAVRGTISAEMWEAVNATWLEARDRASRRHAYSDFFDWVKERSHLFRGATYGTLLRNDAYYFIRLGTFVERADNTARLLDVKSHLMSPAIEDSAPDYYAWSALLHTLSAFEAYRAIYRDSISARRVIELLVLQPDVPRSLCACAVEIRSILDHIQGETGRPAKRLAAKLVAGLEYGSLDDILEQGLHAYLSRFLADVHGLGEAIHRAYLEAA